MYIILTSKPGQYQSEATDGLLPLRTYVYRYDGRHIASFTIAALAHETRVKIVDESASGEVNLVPTKFFEHYPSPEAALQALADLTDASRADAQLLLLGEPVIVS
jgi:hypothetical protein